MRSADLIGAFELMKKIDYQNKLEYYKNRYHHFKNSPYSFNDNQAKVLAGYNRDYIVLWLSIIEDFFRHNLYLDTRQGIVDDKLNRHSIIHGFSTDIYYSLENYLRLFNVIHFLSWAYSMVCPESKYVPDLPEEKVIYKWKAFEKIKLASDLVVEAKQNVYQQYDEVNNSSGILYAPCSSLELQLPALHRKRLEDKLIYIDRVIDNSYKQRSS